MNKIITRNFSEIDEAVSGVNETLFHNANGYLGVRGCLEEGLKDDWDTMRGTYINGFYDVIPMKQAESLCNFVEEKEAILNVVDFQTIGLRIDGESFFLWNGTVIENSRTLNMEEGYTLRKVRWRSPGGKEILLVVKRMASFEKLTLFTMEYQVKALNFSGTLEIESFHMACVKNYSNSKDPRLASESLQNLTVDEFSLIKNGSIAVSRTSRSGLSVCSAVSHIIPGEGNGEIKKTDDTTSVFCLRAEIKENQMVSLEKICILTDSIRYPNPKESALKDLREVCDLGVSHYYQFQKDYMDHFWSQSDLEVFGNESLNKAINFNMYQLLQSSAKDDFCSIAAKGLSGEGYEGHYFWDTETYILPFFTLTNPELSRMLLSYRYQSLDKARENARLLGHKKGALFPWRTITGRECSGYFPSGTAQYHIDGDIAYAVINYYLATKDYLFIKEKGAEMVFETARLWMDVGNYSENHFVINMVTGPDEYTCMVNNNYYTNCSAKYNLLWAVKFLKLLTEHGEDQELRKKLHIAEDESLEMEKAADAMYLPYDERLGINAQDDSFFKKPVWDIANTPKENFPLLLHYHPLHLYRYQVCKQADTVMAYFLFEDEQTREVMKRSYEYYEKITTHDSSLSTCIFSIVASRLGMQEKAYEYLGDSAYLDLNNTHANTKDGIHTANMGGCYMAVVNGFAGLRIKEEGLSISPFVPKEWEGYEFMIRFQNSNLLITVLKSQIKIKVLQGDAVSLKVYDQWVEITPDKEMEFACQEMITR